jgi:SWI/SNF related-matrix-associated actin-dependent regulator of chromatin subfamily C
MDDPTPENSITEIKITAANAGKADLVPRSGGGGTYMDVDETNETLNGGDNASNAVSNAGDENRDDNDENVTEQTHHIIVPSYR